MNPGLGAVLGFLFLGSYAAVSAWFAHRDLDRLARRRAVVHDTDRGGAM